MTNLIEFEQRLKNLIDNPSPTPKYELWQTITYDRGSGKVEGRICGFHFVRVGIAFEENCDPGWRYHIEVEDELAIVTEEEILGVCDVHS